MYFFAFLFFNVTHTYVYIDYNERFVSWRGVARGSRFPPIIVNITNDLYINLLSACADL